MTIKVKIAEAIPAGRYPCILESIENITEKDYSSDAMVEKIKFSFKVKVKQSIREYNYKVSPIVSVKSNLSKIANQMHPDGAVPQDARRDDEAFAKELAGMISKRYQIQLSVNDKGYNVFESIMPLDQVNPLTQEAPVPDFKNDDIPF